MASDDVLSQITPWRRTLDSQRGMAAAALLLLFVLMAVNGAVLVASFSRNEPAELRAVFGDQRAPILVMVCASATAAVLLFIGMLLASFTPDREIARWMRASFVMVCILLATVVLLAFMEARGRDFIGGRQPPLADYAVVGALASAVIFCTWMSSQFLLGRRFGLSRIGTKVAVYSGASLAIVAIEWYVHALGPFLLPDRASLCTVEALVNVVAIAIVFGGYLAIVLPIQDAMSRSLQSAENRTPPEPVREVDWHTPEGRRWFLMRRALTIIAAGTIVLFGTALLTEVVWWASFDRFRRFDPPVIPPGMIVMGIFLMVIGFGLIAVGMLICCGAPNRNAARSAYLGVTCVAIAIAMGVFLAPTMVDAQFAGGRSVLRFVWFMGASIAGMIAVTGFVNGVLVFSAMARAFGTARVGVLGAVYIGLALGALVFAFIGRQAERGIPRESDFVLARFFDIAAAVVILGGPLVLISLTSSAIRLRDSVPGDDASIDVGGADGPGGTH